MKKAILVILLSLTVALSFTGCGCSDAGDMNGSTTNTQNTTQRAATTTHQNNGTVTDGDGIIGNEGSEAGTEDNTMITIIPDATDNMGSPENR
ncbi:MAG: hypothetical protein ACI4GZ_05575 [Ruminococcus sp.]